MGRVVGIAAYDLSAAFDTLDHGMLTSKLEGLGVVGKANEWFRNYLGGRSQRVVYNGSKSTFRRVSYGVPQGSILGPLLFLCLLVDLPRVIESSVGSNSGSSLSVGSSGYADDCIAWATADDTPTAKALLESVSKSIYDYMNHHYLVLNDSKTQVLWIGSEEQPAIRVGNALVPPTDGVDILGVSFDHMLSSKPHLRSTINSARTIAAAIRRLSLHLRRPALQQVALALIVGKVGYGAAVLRPRLKEEDPVNKDMVAVQTAINDCARYILGSSRREQKPVKELLLETGLPSFNRMVVEQIAMETWKGIKHAGPNGVKNPIGEILCPQITRHKVTRAAASLCIPPPTKFKCDSFLWNAYAIWNNCPALRSAPNLNYARRAAKEYAASAPI